MKKYLLSFVIPLALSFQLNAQITITDVDFGNIGDTVLYANDTVAPNNLSVGGTGNQTWDFSSLQLDVYDTVFFIDPASTQFGSYFPNSNLALQDSSNIYYNIKTSQILESEGLAGDPFDLGQDIWMKFTDNMTIAKFPSNFQDSFQDTVLLDMTLPDTFVNMVDSIRFKRVSYNTTTVDAWGNVTTPAGTYNTLRFFRTENTYDSVWTYQFTIWQLVQNSNQTTYNYTWYANGEKYPVLDMDADAPNGFALSAKYKVGNNVIAWIPSTTDALCNGECTGSATAGGVGGQTPYTYQWDANAANQTTQTATGLCAGSYSVTVTDNNSNTSVATAVVSEPSAITCTITKQDASCDTCHNGFATANPSGGTPPYSYAWDDANNQTTQTATGLSAGTYNVTVTDDNGCTFVSSVFVTGLDEQFWLDANISVHPNPTSGLLLLDLKKPGIYRISLYDILGNELLHKNIFHTTSTLDLHGYAKGMYLLRVQYQGMQKTFKVHLIH